MAGEKGRLLTGDTHLEGTRVRAGGILWGCLLKTQGDLVEGRAYARDRARQPCEHAEVDSGLLVIWLEFRMWSEEVGKKGAQESYCELLKHLKMREGSLDVTLEVFGTGEGSEALA